MTATVIPFPTKPRVRNVVDEGRWEVLRAGGVRHRILYERFEGGLLRLEAVCGKGGQPQDADHRHDCMDCRRRGWT